MRVVPRQTNREHLGHGVVLAAVELRNPAQVSCVARPPPDAERCAVQISVQRFSRQAKRVDDNCDRFDGIGRKGSDGFSETGQTHYLGRSIDRGRGTPRWIEREVPPRHAPCGLAFVPKRGAPLRDLTHGQDLGLEAKRTVEGFGHGHECRGGICRLAFEHLLQRSEALRGAFERPRGPEGLLEVLVGNPAVRDQR
jgi:hypothetical protein